MALITPDILLKAYAVGVFPMAERADDSALYWVEPDERGIFPLDRFHVPKSLRKEVRRTAFDIRIDTAFRRVMEECAKKRPSRQSTWINKRILNLYTELHGMDQAHSVECWQGGELVGGLYGVKIGAAFFGESMFSIAPNASKVALVHLVARLNFGGFKLLDAQFMNPHLKTLGAVPVAKGAYKKLLTGAITEAAEFAAFDCDDEPETVLELALGR
jgi:leucyl/phenylalanyl-tRNA---protein transferase